MLIKNTIFITIIFLIITALLIFQLLVLRTYITLYTTVTEIKIDVSIQINILKRQLTKSNFNAESILSNNTKIKITLQELTFHIINGFIITLFQLTPIIILQSLARIQVFLLYTSPLQQGDGSTKQPYTGYDRYCYCHPKHKHPL